MTMHTYTTHYFDLDESDATDDFEDTKDLVERLIIEPYEAGEKITKYVEYDELVAIIIGRTSVDLELWEIFVELYEDMDEEFELTWRITGMTMWQTKFELIRD